MEVPTLREDRMVLEALEAGGQQLAADESRTAGRAQLRPFTRRRPLIRRGHLNATLAKRHNSWNFEIGRSAMTQMQNPVAIARESFACVSLAWQTHESELLAYLRHRLSDTSAADDLLQDVFVKALRQGQGFCTLDNPRAWLFEVARNALVDRARTARPTEPLPEGSAETATPIQEPVAPVDALADCLARALEELSDDDAAILRACDLEGQTQAGFADANALSLPATKSRLLRARKRLRQQLTTACQVRFEADGTVASHVPRPASG